MATTPDKMCFSSALERRFLCPGSARVEAAYPYDSTQSPAAAEGTMLHEATMDILKHGTTKHVLTEEQAQAVNWCVKEVLETTSGIEGEYEIYYEAQMDLAEHGRKNKPRIDIVVMPRDGNVIWVIDLKFGGGFTVHPKYNWQMKDYAVSVWLNFGAASVRSVILQPRVEEEWRRKEYWYDGEALAQAQDDIWRAIEKALEPDAPLVPGQDQCQWCRAKEQCEARKAIIKTIPKHLTVEDHLKVLDPVGRGKLYDHVLAAENWLEDYKAKVEDYILLGGEVAGWEAGTGRETSKWMENVDIIQALQDIALQHDKDPELMMKPVEPIGITEARKILGTGKVVKLLIERLIQKSPGKPKPVKVAA